MSFLNGVLNAVNGTNMATPSFPVGPAPGAAPGPAPGSPAARDMALIRQELAELRAMIQNLAVALNQQHMMAEIDKAHEREMEAIKSKLTGALPGIPNAAVQGLMGGAKGMVNKSG